MRERFDSVVDIDHHHDNSRYGNANLVDGGASSTAEILATVFDRLGVQLTPVIAEALYVGLVTDTGRFQYRTTSPAALRLGAHLVEDGADVHKVYQLVFETVPYSKKKLLGRVLEHAQPFLDGRLLVSYVTRDDLALVEGDEATTEGLIDDLREVEGVQVAGLIREQVPLADGTITPNRVSLRSRGRRRRVADRPQVARRRAQAGGRLLASRLGEGDPRLHRGRGRRAALRVRGVAAYHAEHAGAVPGRKAGRARPRSACCARCGRRSAASSGHAGTLDPFAGGLLLVLAEAATRLAPYLSGWTRRIVPSCSSAQVSTTLDPEGTITLTGGSADRDGRRAGPPPA